MTINQYIAHIYLNVRKLFVTCWQKVAALDIRIAFRKSNRSMEAVTAASTKLQMSDTLSPFKSHDEGCKTIENSSSLNRQCQIECDISMNKILNKITPNDQNGDYSNTVNRTNEINYSVTTNDVTMTDATNNSSYYALNGGKHVFNWMDSIKSNGFHDKENSKQPLAEMDNQYGYRNLDVQTHDEWTNSKQSANKILANLCNDDNGSYLDSIVTSDLSDAEIKLAQKKCLNDIDMVNDVQQTDYEHIVIDNQQRRTRARSESDQCECYHARKLQMRRQSHPDSDVSKILIILSTPTKDLIKFLLLLGDEMVFGTYLYSLFTVYKADSFDRINQSLGCICLCFFFYSFLLY